MQLFKRKKPIIICVDMDDTIENLVETWIQEININYNKNYSIDNIKQWDMSKNFPDLTEDEIFDVLSDITVYDKILPYKDAQEYLEKLNNDSRFKVYIATSTYYKVYTYKMEKVLFKYFPFLRNNQLICISDKQLLNADVLIDDYDGNLINGTYDKILIDKPYNINCKSKNINKVNFLDYRNKVIKRTNNWKDIYNYIITKTNKNLW